MLYLPSIQSSQYHSMRSFIRCHAITLFIVESQVPLSSWYDCHKKGSKLSTNKMKKVAFDPQTTTPFHLFPSLHQIHNGLRALSLLFPIQNVSISEIIGIPFPTSTLEFLWITMLFFSFCFSLERHLNPSPPPLPIPSSSFLFIPRLYWSLPSYTNTSLWRLFPCLFTHTISIPIQRLILHLHHIFMAPCHSIVLPHSVSLSNMFSNLPNYSSLLLIKMDHTELVSSCSLSSSAH